MSINWKTANEEQLRDAEAPQPQNIVKLTKLIDTLVNRKHDYGTCVYAMSIAATAAFHYVAHKLGVSGFQASCADLDILKRTRGYRMGFMIFKAEDLLYPQYNLQDKLDKWIADQRPIVAEEAKKLLASNQEAHPDVIAHWKKLTGV